LSEQNLCPRPRCGRPLRDTAYVCDRCADLLARELLVVAKTAGDAQDTIARLARQGGASGGERLPYDPTAETVLDEAVNTLIAWARHIHEASGRSLPTARLPVPRYCPHASCADLRRSVRTDLVGPVCPPPLPAQHPLEVLVLWLGHREQLDWLRYRPEADEAFDEVEDACRRLIRLVDRPPDRWYAGPCDGCDEQLYPVAGAKVIRCPGCEAEYDPDERKAWLLEQIDEQEATAGAAAVALTALGCHVSADRVRQWAHRNQLLPRAGTKLYRIGDVRELVVQAAHRDLDRRIRQANRDVARQKEMMVA
jgi:hypothetical protein